MTELDVKLLNYNLITDIQKLVIEHYGKNYNTIITKSDTIYALSTPTFILSYDIENSHFFLSFKVGQTGKDVATDVRIIMLVLDITEFSMMEDSHYDIESKSLVFGKEALESKHKDVLKSTGKTKCPMCNRIFTNEYMTPAGICKVCDSLKDKIIWN